MPAVRRSGDVVVRGLIVAKDTVTYTNQDAGTLHARRFIACSASYHDVLKQTPDLWAGLRFRGVQTFDGERLELRDCGDCGSTLAVDSDPAADAETGPLCCVCLNHVDRCKCHLQGEAE